LTCKTTNWPNHAISDHHDAKNLKIFNIFTKIAFLRAKMQKKLDNREGMIVLQ